MNVRIQCLVCLMAIVLVSRAFAEIETIYVAPMSHTDIGFTAPPSEVAAKMEKSAASAIEFARSNPDYVWNFECFWQLDQWLSRNSDPSELIALLKSGRFGLSASYVNPHTSLMSAWAMDQNFRVPVEWAKQHGIQLDWAVMNDVPGHPIDMPQFLSKNGVKYLAVGSNQSLSHRLPEEVSHTPFWWEGPDGSRVLLWISAKEAYVESFTLYGVDPGAARLFNPGVFKKDNEIEIMKLGISGMLKYYTEKKYPYDAVLALHAFDNWGSEPSRNLTAAAKKWNDEVGKPRIVVASPGEFFRHIEKSYGSELPVRRGGWGMQWEPVRVGTPGAMRRARAFEENLKSEANPGLNDVKKLLIYWEHSFGMGPPWPDLVTREQSVQHNREQWDVVHDWPMPALPAVSGEPLSFEKKGFFQDLEQNGLFLAETFFNDVGDVRKLSSAAWLDRSATRGEDGWIRIRHKISRRELGKRATVVWAWKLPEADAEAPVVLKTATGEMNIPGDGLSDYSLSYWVAIDEFRIGGSTFRSHGPFVFSRPKHYKGWLIGRVVDQSLDAEFKGKQRGELTFDEAYPGEGAVYEFGVDILESGGAVKK